MPVRVLHVIKNLEPGGAETNLRNLLRAFSPGRYEHHVAYAGGGPLEAPLRAIPGVRFYRYASKAHRLSDPRTISTVSKLWGYMLRHQIGLIHTHNFNGHFWGVFAAHAAGVKVVEHVHDFRYFDPRELKRRGGDANLNRYIGLFKGLSDRVIVLTEQNRRFLLDGGYYPGSKVRLLANGTPPLERRERDVVRQKIGIGPDRVVILTASRLSRTKNIDLIARVAGRIGAGFPQALFVVAGGGEQLEDHRRKAREAGLEKSVIFLGFYPDMADLLAAADIFLLPSFLELHSIAVLEAMSAGLPVLVSRGVGSHDDLIVDGKIGVLADPYSDGEWADALTRLLGSGTERARLGEAGRRLWQERYEISGVVRRLEELYAELAVP